MFQMPIYSFGSQHYYFVLAVVFSRAHSSASLYEQPEYLLDLDPHLNAYERCSVRIVLNEVLKSEQGTDPSEEHQYADRFKFGSYQVKPLSVPVILSKVSYRFRSVNWILHNRISKGLSYYSLAEMYMICQRNGNHHSYDLHPIQPGSTQNITRHPKLNCAIVLYAEPYPCEKWYHNFEPRYASLNIIALPRSLLDTMLPFPTPLTSDAESKWKEVTDRLHWSSYANTSFEDAFEADLDQQAKSSTTSLNQATSFLLFIHVNKLAPYLGSSTPVSATYDMPLVIRKWFKSTELVTVPLVLLFLVGKVDDTATGQGQCSTVLAKILQECASGEQVAKVFKAVSLECTDKSFWNLLDDGSCEHLLYEKMLDHRSLNFLPLLLSTDFMTLERYQAQCAHYAWVTLDPTGGGSGAIHDTSETRYRSSYLLGRVIPTMAELDHFILLQLFPNSTHYKSNHPTQMAAQKYFPFFRRFADSNIHHYHSYTDGSLMMTFVSELSRQRGCRYGATCLPSSVRCGPLSWRLLC